MSDLATMHSPDCERGLLGAVLIDADHVWFLCAEAGVKAAWFYDPMHRALWSLYERMRHDGRPIDLLIVTERARAMGIIDDIGGEQALERLVDACPSAKMAGYFIGELDDHYKRRAIYDLARAAAHQVKDATVKASDITADLLRDIVAMAAQNARRTKDQVAAEIEQQWVNAKQGVIPGIPSPWPGLNKLLNGVQPREVTLLAGKGGMGKSSLLATWVEFLTRGGYKVGYLPFEDGVVRTTKRLAGISGEFSVFHRDSGSSTEQQIQEAVAHVREVVQRPVYMEDRAMTAEQMMAWAMTMKARHGIQILFIDAFKDVMRPRRDVESDDMLSSAIVEIARRADIGVVVNHHIRKGGVDRSFFSRITEEDMRGSGKIKDDARQVLLLQVENMGSDMSPNLSFSLQVAKNNFGPTGEIPMDRISRLTKWVEKPQQATAA